MNFDYMPELRFQWSYLICWIVMLLLVAIMIVVFRRKQWL
jgi:magnesium transporter